MSDVYDFVLVMIYGFRAIDTPFNKIIELADKVHFNKNTDINLIQKSYT